MKKYFVTALICMSLIAASSMNGQGQAAAPAAELFVGGAKVWTRAPTDRFDTHGGGGSITGYFNRYLGVEAEIFQYADYPEIFTDTYSTHYTFLFGPHFAYRQGSRVTPFAHVLLGGTRGTHQNLEPPPPAIPNTSSALTGRTALTVALGGGLDVHAWRFVWIRAIQADYLHASFPDSAQKSLRLSFGITLHLGRLRAGGKE